MPESFGGRLRRRREEQGIALHSIAEQTKIKLSLLEALERDDVSHWPFGIFRRAFIRAYADAIGLSPDAVVREFLEAHPEPVEAAAPAAALAARADDTPAHSAPPTRLRTLVGSAIGSLTRIRRRAGDENGTPDTAVAAAHPVETDLSAAAPEPSARDAERHEPALPVPDVEIAASPSLPPSGTGRTDGESARPPGPGPDVDFPALAHLCTGFGRIDDPREVQPLLEEAARLLDAVGLIVWIWDPVPAELRPALVHGYSPKVLAHLPGVSGDADNATAAAFRSAKVCVIDGSAHSSGALAVPLVTSGGCAGVLAIELPHGREQSNSVRAAATILAAMLAQFTGSPSAAAPPEAGLDAAAARSATPPAAAAVAGR